MTGVITEHKWHKIYKTLYKDNKYNYHIIGCSKVLAYDKTTRYKKH